MPAILTNSPDACASAEPVWALDWVLELVDGEAVTRTLVVRVASPTFCTEPFAAWRSIVVMEGPCPPEMPIFGATAIQALTLALSMVVDLLSAMTAEGELRDGITGEPVTIDILKATWCGWNFGGDS